MCMTPYQVHCIQEVCNSCYWNRDEVKCNVFVCLFVCEEPEPEPEQKPETDDSSSAEYRNDGYIELVLKVMARMCDGQNKQLQVRVHTLLNLP